MKSLDRSHGSEMSVQRVPGNGYADGTQFKRQQPVRQIAVPASARALSTLAHIDYEDAFIVDVGDPRARSGERWARAIFDEAPNSLRLRLWSAWRMLGLRLAPPTSLQHVLGWSIRRKTTELVLLGADSLIGMPAELLVQRQPDSLLFDTFVQQSNPIAQAIWAATRPTHERTLPSVLNHFTRRLCGCERYS